MKLEKLFSKIEYELLQGSMDVEIDDIIYDSRKAAPGKVFVCMPGSKVDAHKFAPDVASAGASAIVISKDIDIPNGPTIVKVDNPRYALALMSAEFFEHPANKMKTIGITGTKGKTTTSFMVKTMLEAAGKKVGLIGTNGAEIAKEHYKTINTTPESYELQKYFSMMVDSGCEYMVMEVSSQGIKMDRIAGINFDVGLFTNISPDHIGPDEHKDFEEYLSYKAKIFTLCKDGIVNKDDPNYEGMIKGASANMHTFSLEDGKSIIGDDESDTTDGTSFVASDIKSIHTEDFMGTSFAYKGEKNFDVLLDMPGIFNVQNALAAISVCDLLGINEEAICKAMRKVKVAGRMEIAHVSKQCTVIIDYAHNGVSARSMLETLKEYNPKRLVVVFGCGGDRDPHRRYGMGEEVGKACDLAIITTDNPRFEDPNNIIKDIHIGIDPTGCACIEVLDRREAIRTALAGSKEGDLIAIIGKGHEDYQEVCGVRTHLSDKEEVEKVVAELGL